MARGGAERFLLDLLISLDKNIFSPSVILFKDKGPWYKELETLNLPIFSLSKKSLIGINNVWEIYKILKENKTEIVHTQLGGDIRGRLAAKLAKVKIIISTEQNINIDERWFRRFAKIISSFWANEIVAISSAVAQDMRKRYLLPKIKSQLIIPNGLNLKKFFYQENRPKQNPILVGAVGRLTKQKGFDILITAWHKIQLANAKLIIVGEGQEREVLKKQIKNLGLKEQIELAGDISDMPNFYKNLNLMVIPSRWEGLGIVALEAGASGVPIIANDIDGLKDIIDSKTGWPVNASEADNLSKTLKIVLNSLETEEIKIRQRALRSLVETKFSIERVSDEYSKLYLKLWRQAYENTPSK